MLNLLGLYGEHRPLLTLSHQFSTKYGRCSGSRFEGRDPRRSALVVSQTPCGPLPFARSLGPPIRSLAPDGAPCSSSIALLLLLLLSQLKQVRYKKRFDRLRWRLAPSFDPTSRR
ncbi:hypothetical protein ASPVEDRAFT_44852 [Aspergillus versicolor CBS 583.65]|uniref:Uncharacterized protein n=1 Tax=Aspergillus versicolor CBS 583.65 TaxID=1036611 RepID=A0A1L9PVB8_ASPVE|nr:uncharacterized protein ASPVEDRAFT_44852 [Aspergillus versicolor CBS 583.65]OJJ05366.1 hypothetical protein ASPVEDRAFT_44852 [Aspergillus versicolor CBS 583.65]